MARVQSLCEWKRDDLVILSCLVRAGSNMT